MDERQEWLNRRDAVRAALERLLANAEHIFDGKPVRDWTETLAEARAALRIPAAAPVLDLLTEFVAWGDVLETWSEEDGSRTYMTGLDAARLDSFHDRADALLNRLAGQSE